MFPCGNISFFEKSDFQASKVQSCWDKSRGAASRLLGVVVRSHFHPLYRDPCILAVGKIAQYNDLGLKT